MTHDKHTILVAGGDLARRTGRLLQAQGHKVFGLRRSPVNNPDDAFPWISADLARPLGPEQLPKSFTHILFALAPKERNPQAYRDTYITAVRNLAYALDLNAVRRFVFVSSTAVYGPSSDWVNESTPPSPAGFNGEILLEAENQAREILGDRTTILRLSGLYGPGRTRLLERIQAGDISILNGADPWTNRIHIDDAARACAHLLLLAHPEPCYIGSDSRPLRMSDLVEHLAPLLGLPAPDRRVEGGVTAGKRLSNARLLASGFSLNWPDAYLGYRALIDPD